jgi:hypothetical protein
MPTFDNATKVPAGAEWLHEIKHDGFRIRVERDGDRSAGHQGRLPLDEPWHMFLPGLVG